MRKSNLITNFHAYFLFSEMIIFTIEDVLSGFSGSSYLQQQKNYMDPTGAVTVIRRASTIEDCVIWCLEDGCHYLEFTAENAGKQCWYRIEERGF